MVIVLIVEKNMAEKNFLLKRRKNLKNYAQRDRKIKAKKSRMKKSGRSLLSIIEPIILKKSLESKIKIESETGNLSPGSINKKTK